MSEQERFDDLVRRKLEERTFPFAEEDWQGAERLIQAERTRRRRRRFWPFAAALLIGGAGIAYFAVTGKERTLDRSTSAVPMDRTGTHAPLTSAPSAADVTAPAPVPAPGAEATAAPAAEVTRSVAATPIITPEPVSTSTPAAATRPAAAVSRTPSSSLAQGGPERRTPEPVGRHGAPAAPTTTVTEPGRNDADMARIDEHPVTDKEERAPARSTSEAARATQEGRPGTTAVDPAMPTGGAQVTAVPASTMPQPAAAPPHDAQPVVESGAQMLGGTGRTLEPTDRVDSTGTPIEEAVAVDSTLAASGDTAAVPLPLVKPASPWELSAMGGLLWGGGRYSGEPRDLWDADVTTGMGWSAGAEVMHMGRNVGIGTGVHYSTYDERLLALERSLTELDVERFYFLTPVDTTVTLGTDTFSINGQLFHSVISVDTTINVLGVGYDSTTTVTVLRAAREQVNRVSYLEIPLLLDAHLTQGRWMFGLRGGPTLGVLTARRGALPDPSQDGYTDLNDVQFRSLVLGYTARAYIRYRWNSAWSVGLEPVLRGQFGNSLDGELKRRTMAVGVLLSLTYRLR